MHFGYGCFWKKLPSLSKQLMVMTGLLAFPLTVRLEKTAPAKPVLAKSKPAKPATPDPRVVRLTKFLSKLHCPVSVLSEDFVHAADENRLDWRLLPSISVIESSGGKAYRNNNVFGWGQGETFFPSVRAGIHEVAYKLGKSPLYKNRDVMGKLRLYNPDENYAHTVISVMNRISPVVNLRPIKRVRPEGPESIAYTESELAPAGM